MSSRQPIAGIVGEQPQQALEDQAEAVLVGGEEGGSWTGGMDRTLRALTLSLFVRQRLTNYIARQRASDLERLTDLIEAGRVTPDIDRTCSLDQVPAAMRHLAAAKARGKVAITV